MKQIKDEELIALAKLAVQDDPFLLIEQGHLFIKDKVTKKIIPFILNTPQKIVLAKIKEIWKSGKPVRVYLLKARQLGMSTLIEAINYVLSSQIANEDSMVICSDKTNTRHLFDISKRFHSTLQNSDCAIFTDNLEKESASTIEFANKSKIMVLTAGNKDAGRAYTFGFMHCSEISSWDNAEETFTAINQCIPMAPRTIQIVETTAKGLGNYAHRLWTKIEKNTDEEGMIGIFLPWFSNPDYAMSIIDDEHFVLSPEEVDIAQRYKLSNEQMKWRRWCIKINCSDNIDNFRQEYPCTAQEAFIGSGNPVFDVTLLSKIYDNIFSAERNIYKKYYIKDYKDFYRFEIGEGNGLYGDIDMYDMPRDKWDYVCACDTAEGVGGDASVCNVFNIKTLEQVLHYSCDIDPALFAKNVHMIAQLYNKALIIPERNNTGHAFITMLNDHLYYGNIYKFKGDERLGFPTTSITKTQAINYLTRYIREGYFVLHNPNTVRELMSFVNSGSKYTAQSGCHDDEVATLWLIAYVLNEGIFDKVVTNVENSKIPNRSINDLYFFKMQENARLYRAGNTKANRTGY